MIHGTLLHFFLLRFPTIFQALWHHLPKWLLKCVLRAFWPYKKPNHHHHKNIKPLFFCNKTLYKIESGTKYLLSSRPPLPPLTCCLKFDHWSLDFIASAFQMGYPRNRDSEPHPLKSHVENQGLVQSCSLWTLLLLATNQRSPEIIVCLVGFGKGQWK